MSRCVLKTRRFSRWAKKAGLTDKALLEVVGEMVSGAVGDNLGGNVYKKRVALPGRGKRGSIRTIIVTNLGDRWVFLFGFEKSDTENISREFLMQAKLFARQVIECDINAFMAMIDVAGLERVSDDD